MQFFISKIQNKIKDLNSKLYIFQQIKPNECCLSVYLWLLMNIHNLEEIQILF